MLVCSPLGHMTGFAAGMLLGLKIGATVIFQDVWEPKRGVTIMAEEGVTYSAGAATFLSDMCEAVAAGAPKPARLRKFLCAGRADSAGPDRTGLSRTRSQGLLAVGHDGIAVEHADGAGARAGEILQDRRPPARRRRGEGCCAWTVRPRRSARPARLRCAARRCVLATTSGRTWSRSTPRAGSTPAISPTADDEGYIRINGRLEGHHHPRRRERADRRDRESALQTSGCARRRAGRLSGFAARRAGLRVRRAAAGP